MQPPLPPLLPLQIIKQQTVKAMARNNLKEYDTTTTIIINPYLAREIVTIVVGVESKRRRRQRRQRRRCFISPGIGYGNSSTADRQLLVGIYFFKNIVMILSHKIIC
jgi:orotidine-5'-phosphate decarboxylase